MFEPVLVAFAAALVAGHFEMAVLGRLDFVRGVAIGADRAALVALGEQLAVDALVVGLLDADVAFAAGLGDVGVVDRRIAIHAALDVVHAVAVVAGRRDDEAHLQQRAAVDAVHVLRRRLRELHLVFLGEPGIAVALGAGLRKVEFENGRLPVPGREDVVVAVAVGTGGGAGSTHRAAHPVDAGFKMVSSPFGGGGREIRWGGEIFFWEGPWSGHCGSASRKGSCEPNRPFWPRPHRGNNPALSILLSRSFWP